MGWDEIGTLISSSMKKNSMDKKENGLNKSSLGAEGKNKMAILAKAQSK